jgi:dienelactone hydrolase
LAGGSLAAEEVETAPAVAPIDQRIEALVERAPLSMLFRGTTAEECRRWQAEFAERLRSLLGPHQPPGHWTNVLERRTELTDHVREEHLLTAPGLPPVPFYLLIPPSRRPGRLPAILAVHGHGEFGHDSVAGIDDTPGRRANIAKSNYDYGRKLVRRGFIVAAPCMTPFGRRLGKPLSALKSDPCTLTALRLQYLGRLLIAENLRDLLWTLQFLAQHEAVDPERLGCVGLSYGGRMTMLTSALEPRIRVAVVSGALNCFQERIKTGSVAGCQVIPRLLEYGDVPEIGSLIAPRPCVWEVGSRDPLISPDWAEKALVRLRRAYAALGAAQMLHVDRFDGAHEWHGDVAYRVLDASLKG